MVRKFSPRNGTALTGACCLTALLSGSVSHSFGQGYGLPPKPEVSQPLKYGPFDVLYGVRGSMVYDDNIYISTNKQSDVIWTVAPDVTLGLGDYREQAGNFLSLDYTPNVILFTDQSRNDAIDHEALL